MASGRLTEPYSHAVDFLISGAGSAAFSPDNCADDNALPHTTLLFTYGADCTS